MAPRLQTLVADLLDAYPRQRHQLVASGLAESAVRRYLDELKDVPLDDLEPAIRACVRTNEWLPSIAEIRAAAARHQLRLPEDAAALAQIDARIAWAREGEDGRGDAPVVHPLVRQILDHLGGWHNFRSAENAAMTRGQFVKLYRDARAQAVRDAQVGDAWT